MRIAIIINANGRRGIEAAAYLAQLANELFIRKAKPGWWRKIEGIKSPYLYQSGVRYQREDRCEEAREGESCSEERFVTIPELYRLGVGDCDDLAAARAAELRVLEKDRGARVLVLEIRPGHYHVVVRRGDGTIEDPSARLGMLARDVDAYEAERNAAGR